MQATVHEFDEDTGGGKLIRDDGIVLTFTPEVFDASGLRLLRIGQRLTIEGDDISVSKLWIVGIGDDQIIR